MKEKPQLQRVAETWGFFIGLFLELVHKGLFTANHKNKDQENDRRVCVCVCKCASVQDYGEVLR